MGSFPTLPQKTKQINSRNNTCSANLLFVTYSSTSLKLNNLIENNYNKEEKPLKILNKVSFFLWPLDCIKNKAVFCSILGNFCNVSRQSYNMANDK